MLFNGVMASPAQHGFWRDVLNLLPLTRFASNVLDATGPCLLTGAYLSYGTPEEVRVDSCHLFCAEDAKGRTAAAYTKSTAMPIARHHWANTWVGQRKRARLGLHARTAFYRGRHLLTRGKTLNPDDARRRVDPHVLARPAPAGEHVAVLVPVRDAVTLIEPFVAALLTLDYPTSTLKLVFCEGDSTDGTWDRLVEVAAGYRGEFRDIVLTRRPVGTRIDRATRWKPRLQRRRREGLAIVRNHLIDQGLAADDDWALWIDIDIWRFPPDVLRQLIGTGARIAAPHCVCHAGGRTFDRNSFVARPFDYAYRYYKQVRHGLHQPPETYSEGRIHMDELRHSKRVLLDGVGGTMLLVDANLHRGGLRFPELPYREHIETEGFGLLARDLGVRAIGLPQLEIMHVPW
jgi:hypothetical protein